MDIHHHVAGKKKHIRPAATFFVSLFSSRTEQTLFIISILSFLFFASHPQGFFFLFFLIFSRYLGNGGPPQFDCQHNHSTIFASFFVSFHDMMARQDQSSNKSSAFASFHSADVIFKISFFFWPIELFFCFKF